ncbi:MAG TPA: hypothetical protein VFW83_07470, partial [Bryobacteraceae bacterium]|nr:hypothetical protein [Bryobacteraceae bacterium]
MKSRILFRSAPALLALACLGAPALHSQEPHKPAAQHHPWDNKSLSPDQRADMVQKQLTLDEKIQLVHGTGWGALRPGAP